MINYRHWFWAFLLIAVAPAATSASSPTSPTGWDSTVIARGNHRKQIEETDILLRANRPFHFYGNTVRRLHYQGRLIPSLREVGAGAVALIRRR